MIEAEIWKPVPSLQHYEVSSFGRVRVPPYTAPMPNGGVRTYGGDETFGTWRDDVRRFMFTWRGKNYKVASLVCEAFHGPRPSNRHVCMHLDEDSRNNRPENLAWGTQKENLSAPGYRDWLMSNRREYKKLTARCAAEIRIAVNYGESMASAAKRYAVSACHVSRICSGHVW